MISPLSRRTFLRQCGATVWTGLKFCYKWQFAHLYIVIQINRFRFIFRHTFLQLLSYSHNFWRSQLRTFSASNDIQQLSTHILHATSTLPPLYRAKSITIKLDRPAFKQCHFVETIQHKKALLSQRRPRDAPNIRVPWKVSRVLANAPGYFSRNL